MLRKILRTFQPNFYHYVKKIDAQAKKWFSYKKNPCIFTTKLHIFYISYCDVVLKRNEFLWIFVR